MIDNGIILKCVDVLNILLAVIACISALRYLYRHPIGYRKWGAWLVVFSSFWFITNGIAVLWGRPMIYIGMDMFSLAVNQSIGNLAVIMLLRRNPTTVVDADDVRVILYHFNRAEQEITARYQAAISVTAGKEIQQHGLD